MNNDTCQYIYAVEVGTPYDIQELNDGILIKEYLTSKETDKYSVLKRDAAEKLVSGGKKSLDETKYINILLEAAQYTLVPDSENSSLGNSASENSASENSSVGNSASENSSVGNSASENSSVGNSSVENSASEKSSVENSSVENSASKNSSVENSASEKSSVGKPSVENSASSKTPKNEARVPKTPQEKFYDFWMIYINEDGTDGFHRMTGRSSVKMREYLDTIRRAHEEYLLKGALRYLQRKENPAEFGALYEKPKDTLFDMFFEVIEVPSDKSEVKVEDKGKELIPDDTFTKLLKDMQIKESIVKGHFTAIATAYTKAMNIIESDVKEEFSKLGGYVDKDININKNAIVKILIEVESTIGENRKEIVDLERKLLDKPDEAVSKELESTKKFIEESNKYVDSIRRYRNAAVLPERVIRAFQVIKPRVRGILAKRQLFNELKEQYKYAVRLISDPSLKPNKAPPAIAVADEDEDYETENEADESNNGTEGSIGSGTAELIKKPVKEKKAGVPRQTLSGRVVKPTAPGGRGPRRKTRKALSKLSH
jgi:hypothetical protein